MILNDTFRFDIPATLEKGSDGKIWVSGIASTEKKDLQGEIVKKDGYILDYFLTKGFLNDNHLKDTGSKVGVPTEAKVTKDGLYIKGYMLTTDSAKKIVELAKALKAAGSDRTLGFSVEGKVIERDKKDPNVITKCWIKDVAITSEPIGVGTYAEFSKSLFSQDLRNVFVDNPEDFIKSDVQEEDDEDGDDENKEDPEESKIDSEEEEKDGKGGVVSQKDIEEKDAEKTATDALSLGNKKQDIDKNIEDVDVPIAPKAGKKSMNKSAGETADGNRNPETNHSPSKGYKFNHSTVEMLHKNTPENRKKKWHDKESHPVKVTEYEHKGSLPKKNYVSVHSSDLGHMVVHTQHHKTADGDSSFHSKFSQFAPKDTKSASEYLKANHGIDHDFSNEAKKSLADDKFNIFVLKSQISGYKKDSDSGDKRPAQYSLYQREDVRNSINVLSIQKSHYVTHSVQDLDGNETSVAANVLSTEDAKIFLKSFGIDHNFDVDADINKSFCVAQDENIFCENCKNTVEKGSPFAIYEGNCFCDDSCFEKALVTGYAFGVTDQVGGSALRVEDLEGKLNDLSFAPDLKVKNVSFDTASANGGKTEVTLRDALDFMSRRGIPQDMADRILVLMIKNDGKLKVTK